MNFLGILAGLALFLFLVTIHEGGHFLGAKFSGIKVNEFSVGMGPGLIKKQKGETLYSLRALPIGGYVMMEGEEEGSNHPRSYDNSAAWKRFITIFAGPFTNFLFAFIVFIFVGLFAGYGSNVIDQVQADSPAQVAGIQAGDKIIEINGSKTRYFNDILSQIEASEGDISLVISRDGNQEKLTIKPITQDGRSIIGIQSRVAKDFLGSLGYAFNNTIFMTKMIWQGLVGLVTGVFGIDQLSGPVAVIGQVSQSVSYGFLTFLNFAALISVNLGLFNLLPIPALDGSKLLLIIIEMITGKKLNKKIEQNITIAGFILLMGLMIFVTFKDIISLF